MNLNATLIAQLVVFFILAWFTMKFVWPPIVKALDERANKIADGLAAADKAKADLSLAEKKVVEELRKARESAGDVRTSAEKQASHLIDDARAEEVRPDAVDEDAGGQRVAVRNDALCELTPAGCRDRGWVGTVRYGGKECGRCGASGQPHGHRRRNGRWQPRSRVRRGRGEGLAGLCLPGPH